MATFQAKIHPAWIRGQIFRGLLFFAFAALFIYDGAYAWPKQNKVAEEYFRFVDEQGKSKRDWPAHAEKLGLGRVKETYKKEHIKNQRQLNEQFIWAAGLGLVGLAFLGKILLDGKKVLSYDETALISPEGKRVPLAAIKALDTAKWEKKGLGYVRYEEDGEQKKLTLDDLRYNGAEKVLEHAQAYLGLPLESEERKRKQAEAEKLERERDQAGPDTANQV